MTYRIGLAQCDAVLGDVDKNFALHLEWIEKARAAGVDQLIFPELSLTGYLLQDMVSELSMAVDDKRLAELAKAVGPMTIAVGGIEETSDHAQYITCFVISDGKVIHRHRKVYLAAYGVFDEARYVGAGRDVRAVDTKHGRTGYVICEDAWHPSLVGVMLLDGAELLAIQVASPVRDLRKGELPHNAVIWLDTLRTYARLYGTHIAFCNRVGAEDGLVFWGHSCVLGPDGEFIQKASLYDEELVVAEIDPEEVRRARLNNPVLREEKIDLTVRELNRVLGVEGERE